MVDINFLNKQAKEYTNLMNTAKINNDLGDYIYYKERLDYINKRIEFRTSNKNKSLRNFKKAAGHN